MTYTNHSNSLIKYVNHYGKKIVIEGSHYKDLFTHFFTIMSKIMIEITNLKYDYKIDNSTFSTLYIPDVIKEFIYSLRYTHTFSFVYKNTSFSINIYNNKQNEDYTFIFRKVAFVLLFLMRFSSSHKDTIVIHFYFTKFRKLLPKRGIFNEININSAYTIPCNTNVQSHIYRKEEWLKVLIHEAIHFFNLDFSCVYDSALRTIDQEFYKVIPLKKENIRLYEAYCEFWALQIHCCVIAFCQNNKRTIDYEKTLYKYENLLQNEVRYSLFQMNKILNYNHIQYNDIVSHGSHYYDKQIYNENTYAISYFLVKTILLFHHNEFITWCRRNNSRRNPVLFMRTMENMNNFCLFIKEFYNKPEFLNSLNDSDYDVDKRSIFYNTLTMSLHEMS